MDTKTATFIEQIKSRFKQFNIAHQVMEGNYNQSNSPIKEPFSCDYRISIYLQNNKLGHKDIHIYLNKDNFNLVAVMTTDTTPKLLEISQQLGMLYGIPFKKIIKNESYSSHYYFIF